jgi:septal ring factor EnvC (AmiA/AmiB activator)
MTTLTQLAKDLQIGKGTLYKVLSNLEITPHKQGRSRVLNDEQIQKIQKVIVSASDRRPSETIKRQASNAQTDRSNVAEVLQAQIEHLKKLLDSEKEEKSGLLQRLEQAQGASERVQQLLSVSMSESSKLRQENDRLKLLEHTKPEATEALRKEEVYSRPTAEEFKVAEEPPPATTKQGKKRFVGVRMLSAAAIIGILFYAAITHGGEWLSSSLEKQISAALKIAGTEPDTR